MEDPIIQANLSIIKTYQSRGIVIKKGKGVYLYDDKNQKYLDLMSNYGANILGHCHPLLVKNLTYQIKTLTNLHGSFINDIRSKAAYLLKSKVQTCLLESYKLIFSNSGAEAVDNAIKIGLLLSKKTKNSLL